MNFEAMSIADLRELAGRLDGAANAASDLEAMMGHPVTVNLTSAFSLCVPIFPTAKVATVAVAAPAVDWPADVMMPPPVFVSDPEPEPAPAPVVAPVAVAPKPAPKPALVRKALPPPQWRGWTPEEDAKLLGVVRSNPAASDITLGDIAEPIIGTRTAKAIAMRIAGKLRNQVQAIRKAHVAAQPTAAVAAAPDPQPTPTPISAPATPSGTMPYDDTLSAVRKRLRTHLNALGYVAPFSAGIDCELVERLAMGEKLPAIADDMGIDVGSMKRRFDALILLLRDDRGMIPVDALGMLSKELQAREAHFAARAA